MARLKWRPNAGGMTPQAPSGEGAVSRARRPLAGDLLVTLLPSFTRAAVSRARRPPAVGDAHAGNDCDHRRNVRGDGLYTAACGNRRYPRYATAVAQAANIAPSTLHFASMVLPLAGGAAAYPIFQGNRASRRIGRGPTGGRLKGGDATAAPSMSRSRGHKVLTISQRGLGINAPKKWSRTCVRDYSTGWLWCA